jgi:hypothetical protein
LYVSTALGNPVDFIDGSPLSGLAYNYAANVGYSNQPGGAGPYNYVPVPDAAGYDAAVTAVQIAPSGTMSGSSVAGQPAFTVRFRVRVN